MTKKIGDARMRDTWRERIQVGVIMDRLQKCAGGEVEMSQTQIAAAKILLGKCIPDLSATKNETELKGELAIREIRRTVVDPAQ